MKTTALTRIALALTISTALPALADEFDSAPFGLRFGSSLFRLSTYPDVVAKTGAASASTENTSFNPAALDWTPRSPRNPCEQEFNDRAHIGLSGQALSVNFQNDTRLFITAQSLLFFNRVAPVRVSFIQIRSNEEPLRGNSTRAGKIFEYDLNAFRLEAGKRFGTETNPSRHSIGLSLSYNQAETNLFQPETSFAVPLPAPLGRVRVTSDRAVLASSNRDTFNVRFGWQFAVWHEPSRILTDSNRRGVLNDDRLLWGTVVDYSHYLSKQERFQPFHFERESGLVPPVAIARVEADDRFPKTHFSRHTSQSVVARTGLAWKFWPEDDDWLPGDGKSEPKYEFKRGAGWLNVDYQWSWFEDEVSQLQEHRLHAGIDIPLGRMLVATGGVSADDRGNWTWGLGLKLHALTTPSCAGGDHALDGLLATIAYQHDPLPELGSEFGHGHLWAFALGLAF